jgi:hypothetical protein
MQVWGQGEGKRRYMLRVAIFCKILALLCFELLGFVNSFSRSD